MKRLAVAALAALGCCCASALAAPGDIDTGFGRHGQVRSDLGSAYGIGAIAEQADGRLVLAGTTDLKPPPDVRTKPGELDFAVLRYTAAGRSDGGFARRGRVTMDFGGQDLASAVALQPDGGIVIGGTTRQRDSNTRAMAVARLTSTGRLDPAFGDQGRVVLSGTVAPETVVGLVHLLPTGQLLIVGRGRPGIVLVRLSAAGVPDESFGPGGVRRMPFRGGEGDPSAFLVDSRGGLVVAGVGPPWYSDSTRTVVRERFSLEGEADPVFGSGALGLFNGSPEALALQSDGAILAAMPSGRYADFGAVIRLRRDGVIDGGFGRRPIPFPPLGLLVDQADRIVTTGTTYEPHRALALRRLLPDGRKDPSFNERRRRSFRDWDPWDAIITRDGEIVVASLLSSRKPASPFAARDPDFALMRVHGGSDTQAPKLSVTGAPGGCVRRGFRLRVTVSDDHAVRGLVGRLDGRRVLAVRRSRAVVRVRAARLRPGRHRLELRARDRSDNPAALKLRFRRCR